MTLKWGVSENEKGNSMAQLKKVEDVVATILDYGTFQSLGDRLSQDFRKVNYYSPIESEYRNVKECVIGDGLTREGHRIERIDEFMTPEVIKESDLFLFSDIGWGGTQRYLKSIGKAVWGSMGADELELYRTRFLKVIEKLGLPVIGYVKIVGLTKLAEHLKTVKNKFVKVNVYRDNMESWHHIDWDHSQRILEHLAVEFGGVKELVVFVVQDPIEDALEIGYDGWSIDGQYPSASYQGLELKNELYVGAKTSYEKLPEEIRVVNEKISRTLSTYQYRNFIATEVRVKDGKSYFIDPTCYSDDTEVLTLQGWRLFKDLNGTELFCTLHPETNQIEYQQATGSIRRAFNGEMISMSNRQKSLEFLITPNHSVWARKKRGKPLIEYRADRLKGTSFLIPRTGEWGGIEASTFTVPEYQNTWHSGKGKGIDKTVNRPAITIGMDDWLRFLAIFLSEGSCRKWQIEISQTKYVSKFRDILSKLPFKWTRHPHGFRTADVQLCSLLRNTGDRATRGIPDYVKNLSQRQINIFLDAYVLGDGNVKHGNRQVTTTSKRTADDIQELFLKAGSIANIFVSKRAGTPVNVSNGKYVSKHDALKICERRNFRDFFCEGWDSKRASQYLSKRPYNGWVYDVEVPNHILYVRRNGKPCFSGNCRMPGQTGEQLTETCTNLPEVIWRGANGELVKPDFGYDFAVEATIHYTENTPGEWRTIRVPKSVERWTKLYHYCIVDDVYHFPPGRNDELGVLLGVGDTIEAAIAHLKRVYEAFKGEPICIRLEKMADLLKQAKDAEKKGVEFTTKKIPSPEIMLKK
jgi:hypothetical protein